MDCLHDTPEIQNEASSSKTKEWLTSEEAAAYLSIPIGTLRNLTSNGKITYYKFGRLNRYLQSDLRRLLLSQKRRASYGN